ncbi:Xanthine/uracil/thiamine/ascorbate permease family protein [Enterobacter cancerogenus]|uniref:Xanthine/uracil/thiamine/ascorbate permease family protein n=1 Tax=Enterobacter cancerogenus TaxID=69218 RepID=A0A484YFZ4_9ENTR|nr:Xanthine/uracil/thiamine/ascorbate permease family protein [Enterobacter cancerogenus]
MADNTVNSPAPGSWLERRFALRARGSTVRTECLAGITGFLAAAYLLVVIPGLLAVGGMDKGAATTGTILVFVAGTLLMAFYANLPFIVGPGIGGSVLVGVTLAGSEGIGWQIGLGIACWSGILFFLLTRFGLREVVTRSVPQSIKLGLTASIGLFVAVLGFRNAGLVLANAKTNALMLGDFLSPAALVALAGLFLAIALQARRIPGGDPVGNPVCHADWHPGWRNKIARAFSRSPPLADPGVGPYRYAGCAQHCLSAVPVRLLRIGIFLHHGNHAGGRR